MISLVCEPGTELAAQELASAIQQRFDTPSPPELCAAASTWDQPAWDDVLLVLYRSAALLPWAHDVVVRFRDTHATVDPATGRPSPGGFVIPVTVAATSTQPPEPIAALKGTPFDGSAATLESVLRAIAVFLGLALRPGEHHIFVSYRASDGKAIAADLHQRLHAAGFHPWLDEAPDELPAGSNVQQVIRDHVRRAAMVLVVDTPDAPQSRWIHEEIASAIGEQIPVLPLVIGDDVSRFLSLASLRRRVDVATRGAGAPLADDEWADVLAHIQELLLAAYVRRTKLRAYAERAFTAAGFTWLAIDEARRMFKARRQRQALPPNVVLSHCSIHDATYVPALKAYADFIARLGNLAEINHKVCIYDRERVLSDPEIDAIAQEFGALPFILAHYNELGVLILSNFERLR